MINSKTSLGGQLKRLLLVCLVPMLIIVIHLVIQLYQFDSKYDTTIRRITKANEFNLTFKDNVDYTMYIIVANSERAEDLVDVNSPEEEIHQAETAFQELMDSSVDSDQKNCLKRILKSLESLYECIVEIQDDAKISGMYDKNMERLDLDIRVQTELIQEQIQEYIYDEAADLEAMRETIHKELIRGILAAIVAIILVLLVVLSISRHITNRMTDGINRLLKVARQAGHGDFSARVENQENGSGLEELEELGEGYNQMVERIGNLVEDIQLEQKNLRTMEQKLLQAQINPHFLYNTLDAIIWLAEAGEKEKVVMMVTSLSDFFRTTLSKGRDFITVEEEESHIQSYLRIQQFRYQDILDYEISIPKEMYEYQILKLILQPLVENALYHGIKNKRGLGHIRVTGEVKDGYLAFEVSDDGIGMTPEQLKMVQEEMNSSTEKRKDDPFGFGLFNVVQRIKLNYGPQYGIWISSSFGEGTIARVEIPAIKI